MENYEFKEILLNAINGDKSSIEKIINMYMPVILKQSIDNKIKQIDEDCVSEIIENVYMKIKIYKNFNKF